MLDARHAAGTPQLAFSQWKVKKKGTLPILSHFDRPHTVSKYGREQGHRVLPGR